MTESVFVSLMGGVKVFPLILYFFCLLFFIPYISCQVLRINQRVRLKCTLSELEKCGNNSASYNLNFTRYTSS